jgi:hypothetical protein
MQRLTRRRPAVLLVLQEYVLRRNALCFSLPCLCRSKIVVARSPAAALQPLAHHLHGIDNVPVAWGGKCSLPFEQYPGHKQLLQLVAKLNAGGTPQQHQQQ